MKDEQPDCYVLKRPDSKFVELKLTPDVKKR